MKNFKQYLSLFTNDVYNNINQIDLLSDEDKLFFSGVLKNDIFSFEAAMKTSDIKIKNKINSLISDTKLSKLCKLSYTLSDSQRNFFNNLVDFIRTNNYSFINNDSHDTILNSVINILETDNENAMSEIENILNAYKKVENNNVLEASSLYEQYKSTHIKL